MRKGDPRTRPARCQMGLKDEPGLGPAHDASDGAELRDVTSRIAASPAPTPLPGLRWRAAITTLAVQVTWERILTQHFGNAPQGDRRADPNCGRRAGSPIRSPRRPFIPSYDPVQPCCLVV